MEGEAEVGHLRDGCRPLRAGPGGSHGLVDEPDLTVRGRPEGAQVPGLDPERREPGRGLGDLEVVLVEVVLPVRPQEAVSDEGVDERRR